MVKIELPPRTSTAIANASELAKGLSAQVAVAQKAIDAFRKVAVPTVSPPRLPKIAPQLNRLPDLRAQFVHPFAGVDVAGWFRAASPLLGALGSITHAVHEFNRNIAISFQPFVEMAGELAKHIKRCEAFEQAGWLPHYTSPFHLIGATDDPGEFSRLVADHYVMKWSDLRAEIESSVDAYAIDEEAKAAFRDALNAHECGLYRCVSRTLFPEIERAMRAEFYSDPRQKITSQNKLQEMAGELGLSEMRPSGLLGAALYRALTKHVYEYVDEKGLGDIAKNPVPNRHAALHGYFAYSSQQSSLNAIFIADYMLQVIDATKRNTARCKGEEAGE